MCLSVCSKIGKYDTNRQLPNCQGSLNYLEEIWKTTVSTNSPFHGTIFT